MLAGFLFREIRMLLSGFFRGAVSSHNTFGGYV